MTSSILLDYASRERGPGYWTKRIALFMGYAVLIIGAIFLAMPVFWALVNSFKVDSEYMTYPVQLFPKVAQWKNYIDIWTKTEFAKVAWRTFLLGIGTASLSTFISSMAGYGFARFRVRGQKPLFSIIISQLIVPGIVLLIPQFIVYSRLHLTNTYWPWILGALGGSAFHIFLFRQFFLGFPRELEEAAEVDGCGPFRIFFQIFLPNAKPVIATVMIFSFSGVWGDYLTPLLYLSNDKTLLPVLMVNAFRNPNGNPYLTWTLAANIVYAMPLIIVFFFAQKYILQGVVTTGLKG